MTTPAILPWIVAAVSSFLLGGLWYSPLLFLKPWMTANGLSTETPPPGSGHPA